MASRPTRFLAAVPVMVVAAVIASPAVAAAPSFADACGSVNNFDYAVCERLDYLANSESEDTDKLDLVWWGVWASVGMSFVLVLSPMFVKSFRFLRE
jgi:hypothetical protein